MNLFGFIFFVSSVFWATQWWFRFVSFFSLLFYTFFFSKVKTVFDNFIEILKLVHDWRHNSSACASSSSSPSLCGIVRRKNNGPTEPIARRKEEKKKRNSHIESGISFSSQYEHRLNNGQRARAISCIDTTMSTRRLLCLGSLSEVSAQTQSRWRK